MLCVYVINTPCTQIFIFLSSDVTTALGNSFDVNVELLHIDLDISKICHDDNTYIT